jgi:hypothetical protein
MERTMKSPLDHTCRHGLASSHARTLTLHATRVAIELGRLAACESEQATFHRALAALRAELSAIERLSAEFECTDEERRVFGF